MNKIHLGEHILGLSTHIDHCTMQPHFLVDNQHRRLLHVLHTTQDHLYELDLDFQLDLNIHIETKLSVCKRIICIVYEF